MRLITILTLFAILLRYAATNENSSEAADSKLVKSLRRQLIKDNYDYITDESEEYLPENHNFRKQYKSDEARNVNIIDKNFNSKENMKQTRITKHELNIKRKDISENKDTIKDLNSNISGIESKDENLRHIIHKKNRRRQQRMKKDSGYVKPKSTIEQPAQENIISFGNVPAKYEDPSNVTKYKILKIRNKYRRNNNLATLIQEETPYSVAIVNLGNAPFPQFRLPSSRRQYMHDPLDLGAFDDDDELPPPPAHDTKSSLEASDEKTNTESSTLTQVEQHSKNNFLDPLLKITITPDEILVL